MMKVSHHLLVYLSLEGGLIRQQCHPPNLKDKTISLISDVKNVFAQQLSEISLLRISCMF